MHSISYETNTNTTFQSMSSIISNDPCKSSPICCAFNFSCVCNVSSVFTRSQVLQSADLMRLIKLCGKIAHVHILLLMQAPLQGQSPSQRPATHAQTTSPSSATAVVDPIAGLPSLRLAARSIPVELQRTHPVSKPGQPVGYHFSLVCMLARSHFMHKCCAAQHIM